MISKPIEWTDREIQLLKKHYSTSTKEELEGMFGYSSDRIRRKAYSLGLRKTKELVSKAMFQNGQPPWNKGKKQADYMSPEMLKRSKATRFKKGNIPHNTRPMGSMRIDDDGYIRIKVRERGPYAFLHREVWKQHHGSIPKGHNIQFKDGDITNVDISNLYIISRQEQMKQNSGTINLSDGLVATYLAGTNRSTPELRAEMLKHPRLIALKRQQLLTLRKIKKNDKARQTRKNDR